MEFIGPNPGSPEYDEIYGELDKQHKSNGGQNVNLWECIFFSILPAAAILFGVIIALNTGRSNSYHNQHCISYSK